MAIYNYNAINEDYDYYDDEYDDMLYEEYIDNIDCIDENQLNRMEKVKHALKTEMDYGNPFDKEPWERHAIQNAYNDADLMAHRIKFRKEDERKHRKDFLAGKGYYGDRTTNASRVRGRKDGESLEEYKNRLKSKPQFSSKGLNDNFRNRRMKEENDRLDGAPCKTGKHAGKHYNLR